ncbi:hypothetical protein AWB78_05351 [Caballeronia calidae]|uniref:Lipoprotein n=1 Tax=Caballeronia calidae TaxID=1777139 RepID=A0A158DM19_9BURK|nr:hypothetical protein [Caballeronia calidae]SAK95648.1 hypothetical protein AWB78_05351 [Caballeronia calidae]
MRKLLVVIWLLMAVPVLGRAQDAAPGFADYPSVVEAARRPLKLRLTTSESRRYATQLTEAANAPVDFAGHYILAEWGCGASCVMAAAIDAKTGKVIMLPFTVSDWPLDITEPLVHRKDSSLLIVHGSRNEQGRGVYYYRFDGTAFRLIKASVLSLRSPTPPAPPDSDTTPARRTSTARSPSKA